MQGHASTHAEAVAVPRTFTRTIPRMVPSAATRIRFTYEHDAGTWWMSFVVPPPDRVRLASSHVPVPVADALEDLPRVIGSDRGRCCVVHPIASPCVNHQRSTPMKALFVAVLAAAMQVPYAQGQSPSGSLGVVADSTYT